MQIKGFSTNLFGFTYQYEQIHGKQAPMDLIVKQIADSGVQAFEADPTNEVVELAKENGMILSATYLGLNLHERNENLDLDNTLYPLLERMARHDVKYLLLNADAKGGWSNPLVKTDEELKIQGSNITKIDVIAKTYDIVSCFHNHAATKPLAEGDLRSITEFGSKEIKMCIDIGWAHVSGYNPIDCISTYAGRVAAVHLRNQKGLVPTEDLMEGELNVKRILSVLKDIKYNGWMTLELYHLPETQASISVGEATKRSTAFTKACYGL